MNEISFEQLYGEDKNLAMALFLAWSNSVLEGLGLPSPLPVDFTKAHSFVSTLRETNFPANGGFQKASPFKKAASAYVWLHADSPFAASLPAEIVGDHIARFSNAATTMIGFAMVKSCLEGVVLHRTDGHDVQLKKPISLSNHFFCDLVEASSRMTPETHFHICSLLFEALAYESNPEVCYPKVF